ncbi:MAG: hypothetical protein KA180_14685 [Gemmatimonadales bacterium]|jgi:hypothetical protein|nr:hypothetical protein [Gemmatimonadales bacterium]MBP9201868.1 hypothetical protein [Gemmatimonadales bacterium]
MISRRMHLSGALLGSLLSAPPATSPAPSPEEYPTTCQWNGCPNTGFDVCFVTSTYYLCVKPLL